MLRWQIMVALLACLAILLAAIIVLVVTRARYHAQLGAAGPVPTAVHMPLVFSLVSLIFLTGPCMAFVGLIPPVRSLFSDIACPPGWTVVGKTFHTGSIGGTALAGACEQGGHDVEVSWLFRFACFFFIAAVAAIVGLGLMLRRWLAVRQRST
jgi:hypothetical protein